jgi:hyperpolarization activated cyclic nucleotide-gated potassium channel 1
MKRGKAVAPLDPFLTTPTDPDDTLKSPGHPLDTVRTWEDHSEGYVSPNSAEKSKRYRALWRKAFIKIKLDRALKRIGDDIIIFGTQNELLDQNMQYKQNIDQLIDKKSKKQEDFRHATIYSIDQEGHFCFITPNSSFKLVWNVVMCLLLLYTAFVMPYRIAFESVNFWDGWACFELTVDVLFFVDVTLEFFTMGVEGDGELVTDRWKIARTYLTSWFLIDITACIPFALIEYLSGVEEEKTSSRYNTLIRLLRLPRLYKLFRITRVLRMFKSTAISSTSDRINEFLQINSRIHYSGLWKLLKFLLSVSVCVHVSSCLWYFIARLSNFDHTCWVMKYRLYDQSQARLYLTSVYWAVTTITTVGYGDITPGNELERAFAFMWMLIGVGFYSFTIGSLSSVLTSIDSRESILNSKMAAIHEFAAETGISKETKMKIRHAVQENAIKRGLVWSDKHALFSELPKNLRFEVATNMYKGIYSLFPLFKERDSAFMSYIMYKLRPIKYRHEEFLYKENDFADEVYFISEGRVNLVTRGSFIVYKSFLRGSYLGEIEIVLLKPRQNTAQCFGDTQLLIISREDFREMLKTFPTEAKQITKVAKLRAKKNNEAYQETVRLLELKRVKGSLKDLAGHQRLSNIEEVEEMSDEEGVLPHE